MSVVVELPVQIDNTDITLAPGPFRSTEITFDIRDDSIAGQEDRVVTLELQYVGPQEFTDSVMIGGDNTFSRIRITIIDDDSEYTKQSRNATLRMCACTVCEVL